MTWDDFERLLCWLLIAGYRPADEAEWRPNELLAFTNREWWRRAMAIESYNERWPHAGIGIPGVLYYR